MRTGVAIVAEHDHVALDEDLADALFVRLVDLPLEAGQLDACGAVIVGGVVVGAYKRRAFGDAVAIYQADADIVKEFADLGSYRGAAADYLTQIAAEYLMQE